MGKQAVTDSQLVVIGSSAGGIEALSRVVSSLPADFPAPIVIAQHLDPRRPSHLSEILARHANLPIKVVEDKAALEDGVIFVIPSNRLVEIVDGALRLRPAKRGAIAPSIDLLLETAATAFGPGLIAVILTGSGSDGSAGAWHVKLNEELTASVEEPRVANEDLAARTLALRLQTVALEEQKQQGEEEHNRLQSVLASLGDAVVAVDHGGRAILTNPAYERLFGGPKASIRPEDVAGVPLPKDDWPQDRAARGERFRMEFARSESDGSRRWFEAVAEPLTSEDRTWGGVLTIRDVSERTMRLSLERVMAAAGHELNTPTAAIHNYLQLVDRHLAGGDMPEAAKYTARALSQTRRMATLVERLLDVSRIKTGQLELLPEVVDLAAVVRSAVEVAEVLPKAPPIRVDVGREPLQVRADADRLHQVFLNLLTNAFEHAPGSGTVEVTVTSSDGHGVVAVRDHGPGVAGKDVRAMFEAYTRLGHPHRAPGLGLGLFVAREIVTAHGGEIEVSSRVGKGTVMKVRLPLASRRGGGKGPAAMAGKGPAAGGRARTSRGTTSSS